MALVRGRISYDSSYFGIGTAMTSIVGANIGANNIVRAERVGNYGGSMAGLVSVLIGFSLAFFLTCGSIILLMTQKLTKSQKNIFKLSALFMPFKG